MPIPDYESLMGPVLKLATDREHSIGQAIELLANEFHLTGEEQAELLPSGRQRTFRNRVQWAIFYLVKAGILIRPRRGHFAATDEGRRVVREGPREINNEFLLRYESFRQFRTRPLAEDAGRETPAPTGDGGTPDEVALRAAAEADAALESELLDRVTKIDPTKFEMVILDLMTAMHYGQDGSVEHLGGTGDGGVDGVISVDPLGLNRVYIQAKKYDRDNAIGPEKIDQFIGALDKKRADLGLFVTTSRFTAAARKAADESSKRIILIDGPELARRMRQHGVGVLQREVIELKRIDTDYFEGEIS